MATAGEPQLDKPDSDALHQRTLRRRTQRLVAILEVAAVLVLILGPSFAYVVGYLIWGGDYNNLASDRRFIASRTESVMNIDSLERMLGKLRLIPVVLFVIWRSGKPWSWFGLVKPKYPKDLLLGLGLWLLIAVLDGFVSIAFKRREPWLPFTRIAVPQARLLWLVGWSCAVGLSEELAMRAYLIPRLETILRSTWKSVALSVLIFGFAHLYQSYVGVIQSLVVATVFGVAFCITRRIWPVAFAHALTDFVIGAHLGPFSGF
jgi:membrane protease YdiL (CAAX protease family)